MNLEFIESLYESFRQDPESVSADWRDYFHALEASGELNGVGTPAPSFTPASMFHPPGGAGVASAGQSAGQAAPDASKSHAVAPPPSPLRPAERAPASAPPTMVPAGASSRGELPGPALGQGGPRSFRPQRPPLGAVVRASEISDEAMRQDRVDQLIRAYRVRGHMIAKIDPLGLPREHQQELDPEFYGLGNDDLSCVFSSQSIYGTETLTLQGILERLQEAYCGSVGVQFMHIDDLEVKNWIQVRVEGGLDVSLSHEQQKRILTKLTDAVIFEEFIQKKYLGAKSFSLEGSESLIPLLDFAIERAADHGAREIVMGMAHRGRLNVLANIMGKGARQIFREFEDADPELYKGSGDVKYHLGHSCDFACSSGETVHLSLCFNPSHLEYPNPVVLGRVRAKQDRLGDHERNAVMGILIHGDAAFAGEGVVQETLNLSQLRAYSTGGTLHIIVNNQIGFTTSPSESRSCTYATDVAKMLQIPIFHVNGEDPEAVARVVCVAMDFRSRFKRDVVIDCYGYRRHGHNEGDEPAFTQPVLYRAIGQRKSVRDGYLDHLLRLGDISQADADQIAVEQREKLEAELTEARRPDYVQTFKWLGGHWEGYRGGPEAAVKESDTGVLLARVQELLLKQSQTPGDFRPHPKIKRLLTQRREMGEGKRPVDWGTGELLAFASLVTHGTRVRLTGQDAARATFSQRHAVLYDSEDGHSYTPLAHLSPDQGPIEVYNSPLSEVGVLGFEYGYSLDWPEGLVAWEAQFGDFANAAQVIIDQFVSSAEDKWRRLSGLVLLLPHGFEGMGPEHSSARLERYLTMAAEDNIQIAQPTTPAQHFHLLRRQALRPWRKPLIVLTPKSLLRLPAATSPLEDFTRGRFQRILPDDEHRSGREISRVLLCSGRVYYDLAQKRKELGRDDIAIVRIEQFYPLSDEHLRGALSPYLDGTPVVWVQDEPENMGAWRHLRAIYGERIFDRLPFSGVCRAESASPATGSANCHKLEQRELLERAFGGS